MEENTLVYIGGELDRKNANKIRKLLPDLEEHIFDHFSSYHPVVDLLKSFSTGELYTYYI